MTLKRIALLSFGVKAKFTVSSFKDNMPNAEHTNKYKIRPISYTPAYMVTNRKSIFITLIKNKS